MRISDWSSDVCSSDLCPPAWSRRATRAPIPCCRGWNFDLMVQDAKVGADETGATVTACLLIIGNEILSGRTQDKNLAFLGERLNGLGIRLTEARTIPDVEATIVPTLNEVRRPTGRAPGRESGGQSV